MAWYFLKSIQHFHFELFLAQKNKSKTRIISVVNLHVTDKSSLVFFEHHINYHDFLLMMIYVHESVCLFCVWTWNKKVVEREGCKKGGKNLIQTARVRRKRCELLHMHAWVKSKIHKLLNNYYTVKRMWGKIHEVRNVSEHEH
jgi:hypothetical protein